MELSDPRTTSIRVMNDIPVWEPSISEEGIEGPTDPPTNMRVRVDGGNVSSSAPQEG
jgi:hypothetical protein